MFWIEGVRRGAEEFLLETVSSQQDRQAVSLRQLSQPLDLGRTTRTRVSTDCAIWRRETGQMYWRQLGIEELQPADRHGVFCFVADGMSYLVPASVLIAALVRPIQRIYPYLFKPQGLESICTPLFEKEGPTVGTYTGQTGVFGSISRASKGLLSSYSWMHCFPSACAMWSSVYLAACEGRLDIELPLARLTMTMRSVRLGKQRLVSEMNITQLNALDAPFNFATEHPNQMVLHESNQLDWKKLFRPAVTIPPRGSEWQLLDQEWEAIKPLLSQRAQRKFCLRKIIDLLLLKFGTGLSWHKLPFRELNFPIVQNTYRQLKKRGQWLAIEATLVAMRSQTAGTILEGRGEVFRQDVSCRNKPVARRELNGKNGKFADKPGSVESNHSSGTDVTASL
jgi:hypothetical protein